MALNNPLNNNDSFPDNSHAAIQDSYPVSEADSDDSMFEQSEASYNSMSTIRSNEVAGYFQSICGFAYQSDEGVPRLFPTNVLSEKSDVISHIIFRLLRGGTNVPPRVDEILRSGGVYGSQGAPRVLQFATNTGVWVREMVDTYSSTVFVSIDTKPLVAHKPHARIKYQVYDFHAGILEPDCIFDVVYIQQGATLTKDFNFLLQEVHRVLKPNGFLLMDVIPMKMFEGVNADIPFFSAKHYAEGIKYVRDFWERQGVDTATWDDLPSRLDGSHPHWENSQSSETHLQSGATSLNRGFHTINLRIETLPLGTWSENQRENIIGGLMRAWIEIAWRNHLPNMVVEGREESEARAFVEGILGDLAAIDKFRTYHEFQLVCAQKM